MSDKRPSAVPEPWWAGLGPVGAMVLVVLSLAGFGLPLLRVPGFSDDPSALVYRCARIAAIGLVIAGITLPARRRAGAQDREDGGRG